MKKVKIYSILSFLILPGVLMMPDAEYFYYVPPIMCIVGGLSFGSLISLTLKKS